VWGAEPETARPPRLVRQGSAQVFPNWKATLSTVRAEKRFPRMWQRMQPLVDGYIVVTLDQVKGRHASHGGEARRHCRGSWCARLAAALTGKAGKGPVFAIVSAAYRNSRSSPS